MTMAFNLCTFFRITGRLKNEQIKNCFGFTRRDFVSIGLSIHIVLKSCPSDFKEYLGWEVHSSTIFDHSWEQVERRWACQILVLLPCCNPNCSAFRSFIYRHLLKKRFYSFKKLQKSLFFLKPPICNSHYSSQTQSLSKQTITLDCIYPIGLLIPFWEQHRPHLQISKSCPSVRTELKCHVPMKIVYIFIF